MKRRRNGHRREMMIHLSRDGKDLGQFTIEQVNALLVTGQLQTTDFSWKEGMPNWVALAQMEGVVAPIAPRSASAPAPVSRPVGTTAPLRATTTTPQAVYAPPRGAVSGSFHQPGQVPPGSIRALKETRPWVLFLAILGIIATGLMLFGGLGMLIMGGVMASQTTSSSMSAVPTAMLGLMAIAYLLLALLYIYPIIKLFKFCGAVKRLTQSGAAQDLDEALRQQKSFWKFIGIMTLVMIVLYLVFIVLIVAGVAFTGLRSSAPSGWPPPPPTLSTPP